MVYPTLTDNFNLAALNANFLELYNQMNVTQSYTPTASNLGTVTRNICYKKNGICEYKLIAKCGNWTAGVEYKIGTLDSSFRPIAAFAKEERLNDQFFGYVSISAVSGNISITPRITISNSTISIDETFISA